MVSNMATNSDIHNMILQLKKTEALLHLYYKAKEDFEKELFILANDFIYTVELSKENIQQKRLRIEQFIKVKNEIALHVGYAKIHNISKAAQDGFADNKTAE